MDSGQLRFLRLDRTPPFCSDVVGEALLLQALLVLEAYENAYFLAPYVLHGEPAQLLQCHMPIPKPCDCISMSSLAMSPRAPTPFCFSTGPDGTQRPTSAFPKTSRQSFCPHARLKSIPSRTSGSTFVPTGSPTASSKLASRSSKQYATLGKGSLPNQRPLPQSDCRNGLMSVRPNDRWCDI